MEKEIQEQGIMDSFFKDYNQNQSMTNLKGTNNEIIKNYEEISNNNISPSILSPKGEKKRRQGLWLNNFFTKEEEKKEENTTPQVTIDDESKKKKKAKIILIQVIEVIKKFENSQIGIIIMLIIICFSIVYYDIKFLCIPLFLRKYFRCLYYIIFSYSSFDFIFRSLIMEQLFCTIYFWVDFFSLISMFFDIDSLSYDFLKKIFFPTHNNKYLSYEEQSFIELIINLFQVLRLLRAIKFYRLLVDIIKERERQKNIKKKIEKLSEKRSKVYRGKSFRQIKVSYTTNLKDVNNNTTTFNLNQTPEILIKSPMKRPKKNSVFTLAPLENENKKWEEDIKKYLEQHVFKQQKISQKVTEGISRLMIIIVILVFIVSIYSDEDNFNKESFSYILMCKIINNYSNKYKIKNFSKIKEFVDNYLITNILTNYPIIQVEWKEHIIYQNKSMKLNFIEDYYRRDISYIYSKQDPSTIIIISKRQISKMTSLIYLLRLIYIVTSVSVLCLLINNDIYNLIFHPLEKIGKVVDIVSKDPVGSKTVTELKNNMEHSSNKKEDQNSVSYEIKIIQSAIIRISALMAINFGEAGGEILKENISSSEGLNPMLQGKKINAIFGFCFIHNFSEINEVFQEKTMIFVNQISDIVHSCVDKFNGITNKNLGDCYLLAWKFKEKTKNNNTTINNMNNNLNNEGKLSLKNSLLTAERNQELADCALLGFLNIIKKINKSQNILVYRKDIDLIKKFGPKYSVQMGFGLHTGWGIEGAIGSYYKIDCSYLSPNVNIAARLETATNIYGVDILLSGEFYDLLSDFMKRKCRKIDIVTLKGSEKPVSLYTVDINKNIHPGKLTSKKDRLTLRERRSYYALKKKKLWHKYNSMRYNYTLGEIYLKQSKGLRQLLKQIKSDMFYTCFEDGFNDYIDGEWKEAAQFLEKARYLDKSDGPTKTILDYIKSLDYKPPTNWDGYRVLTSKT